MKALIGHTGLIGTQLKQSITFDKLYDSSNIATIAGQSFDEVYCAAPSSNRILANQNPEADLDNIINLINHIKSADVKKIILISTVDTQVKDTAYAINRRFLETSLHDPVIIRLPTLVSNNITKNILYDLKHGQYIDSINIDDVYQWYPLDNLAKDLKYISDNNIKEINFVSEPICNLEIIQTFYPQYADQVKKTKINHYDLKPYYYTAKEMFVEFERYCHGN